MLYLKKLIKNAEEQLEALEKQLSLPNIPPSAKSEPKEISNQPIINDSKTNNPDQLDLPNTQLITCNFPGCSNTIWSDKEAWAEGVWIKDDFDHEFYCPKHWDECSSCRKYVGINFIIKHNGSSYCNNCYEDEFITCPNCKKVVEKSEYLKSKPNQYRGLKNGGCTECAYKCCVCKKVVDKDYIYEEDGDEYCEDCHGEFFTSCEKCNEIIYRDNAHYVENKGDFCEYCFNDLYTQCHKCHETIDKDEAHEINDNDYCDSCFEEIGPKQYKHYADNLSSFTYSKKDKLFKQLELLLPISVKDLKAKNSRLADALKDLIIFSKGKDLTLELLNEYRKNISSEEFPVDYTVWGSPLQRSLSKIKKQLPAQLTLNIKASDRILSQLESDPPLKDLFNRINDLSAQSGHPAVENQLGWARLELNPEEKYILVDEIQTDHANAAYKLKNNDSDDYSNIRQALQNKYQLDKAGLDNLLGRLNNLVKDFPDIATAAISQFAKNNGFEKLYWHTYESGKELKNNSPPKSLYDKVPRENFFEESKDQPFGLQGVFFERKATNKLFNLSRKFALKLFKSSK